MFTPCLPASVKRHLNQKTQYRPDAASDVSVPSLFLGVNVAKPDPGSWWGRGRGGAWVVDVLFSLWGGSRATACAL